MDTRVKYYFYFWTTFNNSTFAMNKVLFSLLFLTTLCASVFSQNHSHRCGLDKQSNKWFMKSPEFQDKLFSGFETFAKNKSAKRNDIYVIPVHIIIIHPPGQPIGTGQNFSEAHIQSQIDVLNADFSRKNADTVDTPTSFSVSPTGIRFCLATIGPDGNPTNGITRYAFNGDFDANEYNIKEATRWNRDKYLNIWSAPNIEFLGYAYLPTQTFLPDPILDGVVINSSSFGGPGFGTFQPYHLGRTATHEVGHYLGLLHTWYEEGCSIDDGISDTPLQDIENFGCPSHPSSSCNNSGDMFMNYMDYVNDNCMNAFSTQQGLYMESILTGIRSSLLDSVLSPCQIDEPLLMAVTKENIKCFGQNNGKLIVSATGGTPPYSFTLNNTINNNSGTFDNLPTGMYEVRVRDSKNTIITSFHEISQPLPLLLLIDNITTPTCYNTKNGFFKVHAEGGINGSLYQYLLVNNMETNNNGEFKNLSSGIYNIEVTDDNNCRTEVILSLSSPDSIKWQTELYLPIDCYGNSTGKIEIKGSGGTGSLVYRINSGSFQTQSTFTNLQKGRYSLEIKDVNGCLLKDSFFISEPLPITTQLTFLNSITCFGDKNAEISVNTSGGTVPFSYILDGMAGQHSSIFSGLIAGDHVIITNDKNNCADTLAFYISTPPAIELNEILKVLPDCTQNNGKITVSAIGGTGTSYRYRIGNFQYNTGEFNNLGQGNYTLIITDERECSSTFQIDIAENTDLSFVLDSVLNVKCHGEKTGSITMKTSGGKAPYIYKINQKENADGIYKNLEFGNYTVQIIDSAGCKKSDNIYISQPDKPISIEIKNFSNGNGTGNGTITVQATGGSVPYLYKLGQNHSNTTGTFSNLANGEYKIIVTDTNGCIDSLVFIISKSQDIFHSPHFKIFPNPVQDNLTIETVEKCKEIIIQDITGRLFSLNNSITTELNGVFIENIAIEKLPSGWYQIKCTFIKNSTIYHSFIKI